MSKSDIVDLTLSNVPRPFTPEADRLIGRATFEGQEPLLGAVRLYGGMRRPANDDMFVRLAYLSSRMSRVVQFIADRYSIDAEDLRQHIYYAMWIGMKNQSIRPANEKELFQYVYSVGRHHALRSRSQKDALSQAVYFDDAPSTDAPWSESARFSDDGDAVREIEDMLTSEQQKSEFAGYVALARDKMATSKNRSQRGSRAPGKQTELDLSVLTDGSKVKRPYSTRTAAQARTPGREIASTRIAPRKSSTRETAREIKLEKPAPNALLDRVGRALLGDGYLSDRVPSLPAKTVRPKRGRPSGPSTVEERRTQEQAELHKLYQESCMRAADYARAIGTSNYMLNKYFSATVQVPEELLERAREYQQEIRYLISELNIRYQSPMSQILERWSIELAQRPLLNEELADLLGVTTSTIRRWRKNQAKPSIMKLSEMELKLRKQFGFSH